MSHQHQVTDQDRSFVIDTKSRVIASAESEKLSLVQNDHNSECYTFTMSRYIEGHDMSECDSVQVHYINISTNKTTSSSDVYEVSDMTVDETDNELITFSWLISSNATKYNGTLNFAIRFACLTDDVIDYDWHTSVYSGVTIVAGINNSSALITEYSDILETWKEEFMADVSNAGVTDYDLLTNKPITRLTGTSEDPIIFRNLDSGTYQIYGRCKPYAGSDTTMFATTLIMANVVKNNSMSYIQIFFAYRNQIQYITATDSEHTSNYVPFDNFAIKPTVRTNDYSSAALSVLMSDGLFYQALNALGTLSLTFPEEILDTYNARFTFKSGATATVLVCEETIIWTGKDVVDGVFTPKTNESYYIEFYKNVDGVNAYVRVDNIYEYIDERIAALTS